MQEEATRTSIAFGVQLLCLSGLAISYYFTRSYYRLNFVTDAARVLSLHLAIEGPLVIGAYSFVRDAPDKCGYWKAIGRGFVGLPIGALMNAFVAVILGAPVGIEHWTKTITWSLLMSLFTALKAASGDSQSSCESRGSISRSIGASYEAQILEEQLQFVPASCVFGFSKEGWQRILVHSKTTKRLDYMVSLPAHGAVLGGWIGAWPMPLDWERPWQEWPICVTYGAVGGYLVGILVSLLVISYRVITHHDKSD